MKKLLVLMLVALFLTACATGPRTPPMYYWGNYTATLYNYKKQPGPDTKAAHQATLEQIIARSDELGIRVPPGVYSELGFLLMEDGQTSLARQYFSQERATYPESAVLMDSILNRL